MRALVGAAEDTKRLSFISYRPLQLQRKSEERKFLNMYKQSINLFAVGKEQENFDRK